MISEFKSQSSILRDKDTGGNGRGSDEKLVNRCEREEYGALEKRVKSVIWNNKIDSLPYHVSV